MRYAAFIGLISCLIAQSMSGCSVSPKPAVQATPEDGRFQELTSEVPRSFSDAKHWNQSKICPEGSVLTPFTRYDYDPGQKSHGFKHYFGRSCAIIQTAEPESLIRRLASVTVHDSGSAPTPVKFVPHGPFIWWYESGRRMEVGSFDHGTLSTELSRFEPDGSLAAKD